MMHSGCTRNADNATGRPIDAFDIKKERKDLYGPRPGEFALVDVPELSFLMADGHGNPNTADAYREAVEALYAVSYSVRFAAKKQLDRVHVVASLEGLWWAENPDVFLTGSKDDWSWTMMIHQPDWITPELVESALATAAQKLVPRGKHHEIYLADPRKVEAEKLRTVLRQPVTSD